MSNTALQSSRPHVPALAIEAAQPQALACRTISDALAAPTIRQLTRANGQAQIGVAITAVVTLGMELFAPGRRLNGPQVTVFAERILQDYPHESLADVAVFMRQAAGGELDGGEYFASVDLPRVMAWWRRYMDRKVAEREQLAERESHEQEQAMMQSLGNTPGLLEAAKAASIEAKERRAAEELSARVERLTRHVGSMTDEQLREAYAVHGSAAERSVILREAGRRGLIKQAQQKAIEDKPATQP
jgi:hypothetical protein